jgi:leader peptidase (prepilin peptidase) / N-methyltransferase
MTAAWLTVVGVLGALIGSFGNVVVHRWPLGLSVVRPRSRCPRCERTLGPLDLVPILSWVVLRARCRSCGEPISARYPLVEGAMAAGFVALALTYPVEQAGLTVVPLLALYAMLLMAALIDLDTYLLPDALTLPALALALLGSFLYAPGWGLPTPGEALLGAAVAAGVLVLVNRLGGLVLRRFRDTTERLGPISLDTVNMAAVAGALGGLPVALVAGALQVVASAALRRPVRLPEGAVYAAWAAALLAVALGATAAWGVSALDGLVGSVAGAGAFALLGAVWWWIADWRTPAPAGGPAAASGATAASGLPADDEEPVAMGFGDVKLAGVLGAMLAWDGFLVALLYAVVLGAVVGVTLRLMGGSRFVPFGPFLVIGAFLALASAEPLLDWYLGLLGL